jgi:signal transduction histidine kinase/ligand-binding sensor domain-containing protein
MEPVIKLESGNIRSTDTPVFSRVLALFAMFLITSTAPLVALDPTSHISQYGHTIWRARDGIVGASSPITQTTDGYIWIGTSSGLAHFDGVNFAPWTLPPDIPFGWRHFTALLGASDGSLWIGTSTGLGRRKGGHFRSYSRPEDRWGISSIIQDHAGRIWVTRYRITHGEGAICEALDEGLHCYGPAEGVTVPYGLGLAEDNQGNFWIGSDYLCRWKPGSTCADYLRNGPTDAEINTIAVASGSAPIVWAGAIGFGRKGGVQRFSAGKWDPYSIPASDGAEVESEAMLFDHDGSLWVGTEKEGLYRICNGIVEHYGPADGLSGYQVAAIYEDHEKNLWVTTEGGMDMFRNTPVTSFSIKEGLSSTFPESILASRDGSIWIGNHDGIDVLRDGRKQNLPDWRGGNETHSLYEDHTGTIWFSSGSNLVYWDHGHLHLVELPNDASKDVTGITEDAQHKLWALSSNFLFRLDQGQVEQRIELPKDFVLHGLLAPDLQAGIWIADGADHLFHYSGGQFHPMELKDGSGANAAIEAMIADPDDPLLVTTLKGLFRWDGRRWSVLNSRNGLPCTQLISIAKDAHGSLWLGAYCGLLRIDASELAEWRRDEAVKVAVKIFDRFDGAYPGRKSIGQPYATKTPDGRIWFANGVEVETVDPDHVFQNTILPPVHIETVIADNDAHEPSSATRLPARTRNLEIDYTALSFSVPQKVMFRYKLEGRDTSWQNPGTRRQAFYTDLPPGPYTFHVIACNNDGVWNETGESLHFSIAPAYYQTTWFRALCVVAFSGLLWAFYLLRLHQLHRQLARGAEERVGERLRIARELHDTLLQGFQAVMIQFQAARNMVPRRPIDALHALDEAIAATAEAIAEGREAICDLRPETTAQGDIPELLRAAGRELAGTSNANGQSPSFRVVVEGKPQTISRLLEDEVHRIAREAIRNAFLHASASHIEAEVHYEKNQLRLRVRDDGKGIDPKIVAAGGRSGHWGIPGILERAKRIGSRLEFWTEEGAGTEVELVLPAAIAYEKARNGSRFRLFRRASKNEQRS